MTFLERLKFYLAYYKPLFMPKDWFVFICFLIAVVMTYKSCESSRIKMQEYHKKMEKKQ